MDGVRGSFAKELRKGRSSGWAHSRFDLNLKSGRIKTNLKNGRARGCSSRELRLRFRLNLTPHLQNDAMFSPSKNCRILYRFYYTSSLKLA